ncbi:MAG: heparinase II/III family protein, partial [Phycisphaerae bacterium]
MSPLEKAYYILRHLGPRVIWLRAGVYLSNSLGRTRRIFRAQPWDQIDLAELVRAGTPIDANSYARFKRENPPPFLFPLGQPPEVPRELRTAGVARQPPLPERLRLLAEDRCVYFFRSPSPSPIDWYANPFDGTRSKPGKAWTDVPDYLPDQGDPRMLWEPSRAAWAVDLARARSHGSEVSAGSLFWRWVDSCMEACPPFEGFQWKCGQESAVRFIAIALGFWSLAGDAATSPTRWQQFARLAWATGYRIAHHINYAISQRNNHALSEACGLLLVSQLFPEFHEADAWREKGRRVLAREIRRQTYVDGSYIQQSMNYQRVMLATSLLALRLAELRSEPFERDIYERLGRCGEFLFQMMDSQTGRLPQLGNNDGAHVLPLNECDFTDFRPVIQAAHYLVHRKRRLQRGAWDEDVLWLFGADALTD